MLKTFFPEFEITDTNRLTFSDRLRIMSLLGRNSIFQVDRFSDITNNNTTDHRRVSFAITYDDADITSETIMDILRNFLAGYCRCPVLRKKSSKDFS